MSIQFLATLALLATPQGPSLPSGFLGLYIREFTLPGVHSDVLRQSFTGMIGGREITHIRHERETPSHDWEVKETPISVTYAITYVATREGGDELYIAGLKDNGDAILERWTFDREPGRYVVRFDAAPTPVGVPRGPYSPALSLFGQHPYVPPSRRVDPPNKTVLLEGSYGQFMCMEADPEGRFVLLYEGEDEKLYRLDAGSSNLVLLHSSVTMPTLEQVSSMEARYFPGEGRKYLLRKSLGSVPKSFESFTLIHDSGNDGIFEGFDVYTYDAWKAEPYGQWGDWELFWMIE